MPSSALPFVEISLRAGQYIVRERDEPQNACLLLSGYAYRQKVAGNGGRQNHVDPHEGRRRRPQNSLLGSADHNVQMLTEGRVALIPVPAVRDLAFRRSRVGMAMWYETLVEGSIFREWIFNIGQRNASARIAHLLCEFAVRLELAELGEREQLYAADLAGPLSEAVALTPVHVNRTLKKLADEGLIERSKRDITVGDWRALARFADFDPHYLHTSATPPTWVANLIYLSDFQGD